MEIQTIKKQMKTYRITYEDLSKESGLSISTIKKIFSGVSQYPRIDTIKAIETAFLKLSPQWTEEEKATGVGSHPIVLSDEDAYRLNVLARAEEVLGKEFVDAHIKLLELATENATKK